MTLKRAAPRFRSVTAVLQRGVRTIFKLNYCAVWLKMIFRSWARISSGNFLSVLCEHMAARKIIKVVGPGLKWWRWLVSVGILCGLLMGIRSFTWASPAQSSSPAPSSTDTSNPRKLPSAKAAAAPKKKASSKASVTNKNTRARTRSVGARRRKKPLSPRARRMRQAFVASTSLRPMAQQLVQDRSPAAYAGVEAFARTHAKEDAGSLAWLVMGYAPGI